MTDSDKKTRMGTPAPAGPSWPNAGTSGGVAAGAVAPVPTPEPSVQPSWGDTTQGGEIKPLTPSAAPVYVAPVDPLLGQVLAGRYLIQRKLGEGGMGAVYLSQHTVLEKAVALKVLHGEFARKPDLVERFMQEARAASRIRHENVIDISDFGSTPDGMVFFAMELLQGHDLHEEIARHRLAKTRMPWDRSRKIFLQVCSALAAAHAQGIVHRDLKPENIYLVEWLGHKDFVKLLDFGIAKLTEVSEGDRKLTRTGMLFGTPEYMSPEQARGENVDHRVDVYAMGCILYQLVTGKVPFEAENFMGILSLHLTEPPPVIGPEVWDEIGAPVELEPIIHKALAKSRAERWETIDEMANAIRALHGEDAQPVLEPKVPRAQSSAPRKTAGADAAAAGRQRTEWKGNLQVPADEPLPAPPASSRTPMILGAVVLCAALGAGAFFVFGGKKDGGGGTPAAPPAGGSVIAAPAGAGAVAPEAGAVPSRVAISIESTPPGAEIFDLTRKEVVGTTPYDFELPGSREPRRYTLKLAGYRGKTIELIPIEDIAYKAEMKALDGAAPAEPAVVEVVPQKSRPRAGGSSGTSGAGTGTAGAGSAAAGTTTPDGPTTIPDGPATMPGGEGRRPGGSGRKPSGGSGAGSAATTPGSGKPPETPVVKPPDDPPGGGVPDVIPLKPIGPAAVDPPPPPPPTP